MNLILTDQLLGLEDTDRRLGLIVFHDELHGGPGKVAPNLVHIHLEAVDHVLANLRERPGHRCYKPDAQFLGRRPHAPPAR